MHQMSYTSERTEWLLRGASGRLSAIVGARHAREIAGKARSHMDSRTAAIAFLAAVPHHDYPFAVSAISATLTDT
ncbi:hypothetical protein DNK06_05145 [Pseudomonas daroniae]|uniref:Uncharacterized protein n=1 Tax=Phytopseudomonas daroniae TaxID=2487519 RepID=A0A4Q9QNY9_9GAMM|nr:hypothetical protein DNK06_05145 [Pseudomonas daroniae]TBU92210.1 hypothetical protein DNJ99_07290 [Pseudomonas daroniae]